MQRSLFDQMVDLEQKSIFIVYCKENHNKKEQHALFAVEKYDTEDGHNLYTYDFYPASGVDNSIWGNQNRDVYNKIRLGEVRTRVINLDGVTKEKIFETLKIKNGVFYRNYKQDSCPIPNANLAIEKAELESKNPPYFIYSGKTTNSDPVVVYNCITWIKHLLKDSGVDISASFLTSLVENTTGIAVEECCGMNIPKFGATETSPSLCRLV